MDRNTYQQGCAGKSGCVDDTLASGLTALASTVVGAATGGGAGAAAAFNEVTNNFLSHPQQRDLASELNACKTEAACQAVLQKYQRLSDTNNTALAKAQAQCVSTGDCAERDRLFASGVAWGQGLKNDAVATDPDSAMLQPVLAAANAQSVQNLINRPLSQEVVRLNAASSYDAAGNVQIDPARYVAAIDNRNAQTAMAGAMAPTLLLPGPEDVALGAALATKAGQKIAEVVIVNGQKAWKFLDGATAKVGSREAEELTRARVENNANADSDSWSNKPSGLNETTPIKNTFGKAPNDSDLATHLSIGGPSVKTVYGAHSDAAYRAELAKIGGTDAGPAREIAPGIFERQYQTPDNLAKGKEPLTKTTYDNRWSDQQIFTMSKQASSQVWSEIQKTGVLPPSNSVTTHVNGVPFVVLIGKDKAGNFTVYAHPGKVKP
jgi:hypothetical protein